MVMITGAQRYTNAYATQVVGITVGDKGWRTFIWWRLLQPRESARECWHWTHTHTHSQRLVKASQLLFTVSLMDGMEGVVWIVDMIDWMNGNGELGWFLAACWKWTLLRRCLWLSSCFLWWLMVRFLCVFRSHCKVDCHYLQSVCFRV